MRVRWYTRSWVRRSPVPSHGRTQRLSMRPRHGGCCWLLLPPAATSRSFIDRRREDLAGRGAEAFGFACGREGPADFGEFVCPPPALLFGLLSCPKPGRRKVGLAHRPFLRQL